MHDIRSAAGRGTVRKPHIADELAMPCGADGKLRALAVQSTVQTLETELQYLSKHRPYVTAVT